MRERARTALRDDGRDRQQGGFALLLTVMFLLMLASMAFAGLETVQRDQQVAGHLNRKRMSLHAADAGLAKAMETLQLTGTPAIPVTKLGDAALYPHGRPSFGPDTSNGPAVESLGTGPPSSSSGGGFNLQPTQNGTPQFQMEYFKIRVQGKAPGGSLTRLEFATSALQAN
jgi:hypothetical protein